VIVGARFDGASIDVDPVVALPLRSGTRSPSNRHPVSDTASVEPESRSGLATHGDQKYLQTTFHSSCHAGFEGPRQGLGGTRIAAVQPADGLPSLAFWQPRYPLSVLPLEDRRLCVPASRGFAFSDGGKCRPRRPVRQHCAVRNVNQPADFQRRSTALRRGAADSGFERVGRISYLVSSL